MRAVAPRALRARGAATTPSMRIEVPRNSVGGGPLSAPAPGGGTGGAGGGGGGANGGAWGVDDADGRSGPPPTPGENKQRPLWLQQGLRWRGIHPSRRTGSAASGRSRRRRGGSRRGRPARSLGARRAASREPPRHRPTAAPTGPARAATARCWRYRGRACGGGRAGCAAAAAPVAPPASAAGARAVTSAAGARAAGASAR